MSDKDALDSMIKALEIFTKLHAVFSDDFWLEMSNYLGEQECVTWNDTIHLLEALKDFRETQKN